MQNDLSLIFMQCFSVLHHIVVFNKKYEPNTHNRHNTVVVGERQSIRMFLKYVGKRDLWQQYEHSMNTAIRLRRKTTTTTIIEHFFLTCTSINFQFDDRFYIAWQNWRMYCISTVFISHPNQNRRYSFPLLPSFFTLMNAFLYAL